MQPKVIKSLKEIMYGLIYPAVLGSGLVLFVSHVARDIWHYQTTHASLLRDLTIYPAIAAGLFYISSFSHLTETGKERTKLSYEWLPFFVDWIEVALMFCCFYFLQLIDEHIPVDGPHLFLAYGCLLVDVGVVQPTWRMAAGVNPLTAFPERAIAASCLAFGMIAVDYPKLHPWVDMLIALTALLFVSFYVYRDVKYQREQYERADGEDGRLDRQP